MNNLRAAASGTKPRRGLNAAVLGAVLLAGLGVGVMLPDSTAKLDAAHRQVDGLTTRTELLSAELTGARTDNSSLADSLQDAEAAVRALGRELHVAGRRGDARESKLDQRGKALDRRGEALDQQKKGLGQREEALDQRQEALDQQESELGQREKALDQRQEALAQQESELDQREIELDQQESAMPERDTR